MRTRVLLVVNDDADAKRMARVLSSCRRLEFELTRAASIPLAQQKLRDDMFDAILVELAMPESDGLADLAAIQSDAGDAVVIALVQEDSQKLGLRAIEHGAQEYVVREERAYQLLPLTIAYLSERRHHDQDIADSTTALINTVDAIAMVDANGVCVTANAALQALLRCSPTAIAATPLTSLVHEADRSRVVDALRSKTKTELDVRIVRTDGRIVNVCLSMVPRARGRGHFCFVRDRTRQKLEENKLISASAITAVGSLATGLAHEINNPLAAVLANVEEAVRVSADLEPTITPATKAEFADLRAMLDEALSASQRIQLIVRDLRVFACTEDRQSRVDLNATIEACCNIALAEIRHRARLLKDLTPVPPVLGNEAKLAQVVLNLLVNAAHAMPEGDVGRNQIRIATSLHGPTAVALEVSDTGGGITPASTAHVFDAFFTTKPRRPGMGLSICQAVVALHGGEISIHPGNEIGTVVRVILPALEAEVTKSPLGAPIDKEASKRRVLVVVDDPLIVPTLTHDLASNFEISSARTGREALDLVRAGGTFDAMLCDLTVPELSGIELHAILERDDPALAERTVFLTDPAFSGRAQTFLKATRQPHLEKPVGLTAVRELLTELSGPLRRQRVGHT